MCARGAFWPENTPQVHIARLGVRLPHTDAVTRTRTCALVGGVVTLAASGGMVAAGFYFDATGGGPSDALAVVLWGSLLIGMLLLGTAALLSARGGPRPRA